MDYPCFLIEEINKRVVHHDEDDYDEHLFDVRRVDTGEVILTGVNHIWHNSKDDSGVPVGAMWWENVSASPPNFPSGPQDYTGYDEADMDRIKHNAVEHPDWYPGGIDASTGMPNRQPSFVFEPGPVLCVMTPGGVWRIDSRASNCGLPYDYEHRCWVRHGEPPNITVDKNGLTCAAGAGSIQCGNYHGFLRNGALVP